MNPPRRQNARSPHRIGNPRCAGALKTPATARNSRSGAGPQEGGGKGEEGVMSSGTWPTHHLHEEILCIFPRLQRLTHDMYPLYHAFSWSRLPTNQLPALLGRHSKQMTAGNEGTVEMMSRRHFQTNPIFPYFSSDTKTPHKDCQKPEARGRISMLRSDTIQQR